MSIVDDILGATHEIYTKNKDAWAREERRLEGGDNVLTASEFVRFKNETTRYEERKNQARYLNFPRIHAQTLAGHLGSKAPIPNFGTLGTVRPRDQIDRRSPAELIYYNLDGIGSDGSQWKAWLTDVQERAIATGHRWIMVEMPTRRGTNPDAPVTRAEIEAGHRPFAVEYSPLAVPYWETADGQLDVIVIKCRVGRSGVVNGRWEPASTQDGYYLQVRQGFAGLGDEFTGGGWWLYDSDRKIVVRNGVEQKGNWSKTKGQIPVFPFIAAPSKGTTERPAMSRSLTMELGQIAVGLMNRISERDYDASDAAKSIRIVAGLVGKAGKDSFNLLAEFLEDGNVIAPLMASEDTDGKPITPTIYDTSASAVPAEVFQTIINSSIAEAKEIMVRQVTSTPDSSGESKKAGFGEATSPLLSGLAQRRETAENTLIYFLELRAAVGAPGTVVEPKGVVTWPTEFELAPLLDKIDRNIERMAKIGARSEIVEATLVERALVDDGLWPEKQADQDAARKQLQQSIRAGRIKVLGDAAVAVTSAGGSLEGAVDVVGFDPKDQKKLVNGVEGDRADDGNQTGNPTDPQGDPAAQNGARQAESAAA